MKNIKSMLCILLAMVMMFTLCACGSKDVSGTVEDVDSPEVSGTVEDVDAPEVSDTAEDDDTPTASGSVDDGNTAENDAGSEFDIGHVEGGKYVNSFLGIGCTLDSNWTYANEDELLELIGQTAEAFDDEEMKDSLMNADMFYDMMASSNDGYANINVIIENIGVMYGTVLGEEDLINSNVEALPNEFAAVGMEVESCEAITIQFAGAEHNAIRVHSITEGLDTYQIIVIIKQGSYVGSITFTSFMNDICSELAALFYAV